ncbi:MAG: bactofilin family protein [Bacillota bacterium]
MSDKHPLSQAFSELFSTVSAKPGATAAALAKADLRPDPAKSSAENLAPSSIADQPSPQPEGKELEKTRSARHREVPTVNSTAAMVELHPRQRQASREQVTSIAVGTTILGNMVVNGPAEIKGTLSGDIECSGCLTVSGEIIGCCKTAEIDVLGARIEGNIESQGNVQIRDGAVVIGNVDGQSMQVFGAVKGDILLPGHLTVGSTAVIVGDIQTGTLDIQNGAIIDGHVNVQAAEKANTVFTVKPGKQSHQNGPSC